MADLPAYSLSELMQRARDHIRARVRGADVDYGSDYDITARMLGTVAFMFQKQSDSQVQLLDPRKSFGAFLREYAGTMGVGKTLQETSYAARAATGFVIIRSTTASQTQNAASVLTHADGTAYTLNANATTPAAAANTLRVGHRSGKRRIFQGHVGGGFVSASVGEVYQFSPTSEYCAIYGSDNGSQSEQYVVDLYNELDALPAMHDQFVQKFGVVAAITASVAGAAGNKDPKDTLTISAPSGTIVATATVLSMSGGRDALTPAQMQEAIRRLNGTRLGMMTLAEIRDLALGYPGTKLRECFILPGYDGLGSYTLIPVAQDVPLVNQTDLTALAAHVESNISPVDKIVATPINELKDNLVAIDVQVTEVYAPDWSTGVGLGVAAASSTTRVQLNAGDVTTAVANGLAVNDRIIVACAAAASPYAPYIVQRKVTAIGAAYVDVSDVLPYPPVAGSSYVTAGGPVGQQIIDAIYSFYDNQSPALSSPTQRWMRYPPPEVTDIIQGLAAKVDDVDGVIDAGVIYTAAPTLAVGTVLIPGAVLILMRT